MNTMQKGTYRTIAKSVREFKRPAILTPILVTGEVIMEAIIPFVISLLVNDVRAGAGVNQILSYAWKLILLALLSLLFGYLAGFNCAKASTGFARNLRKDVYSNIQKFSFSNIDYFSSASLVTRLTTDIQQIQMAFMMLIRMAFRAPLNLIFSFTMAYIMGGSMAVIFLIIMPILAIGLFAISRIVMPIFRKAFPKYDTLNNSVEENIKGIRVVKSYVREEYEKEKFANASEDIRKTFTKAERILAFNGPLMQICIYAVMLFVMAVGSERIITTNGVALNIGQYSTLLTYSFQILSSLMMLSMMFVMMTFSQESCRRVAEVLNAESTITNAENPVMEVKDGSIDFNHVFFRYSQAANIPVLEDIDLHIKSGETIGIVGGTGSSKSSLVQLIPRLYDATEGSVCVGGVDVKDIDLVTLRDRWIIHLNQDLFGWT